MSSVMSMRLDHLEQTFGGLDKHHDYLENPSQCSILHTDGIAKKLAEKLGIP